MKKEFVINIGFLVFINLLIKPFYLFGIDRSVQNVVAPGEYGLYFALLNFTFLFQIVNDFGIQSFNNRHIAQNNQLLDQYFPNTLVLKGLLALLYAVVVMIAAGISGYSASYLPLLILIAFNQILLSLILFLRSNISGLAMYRVDSIVSVLDRLLLIIICSVLLWVEPFRSKFQLIWFVYAQTVSLLLTAGIAFWIVYQKTTRLRFRLDWTFLLQILKKSYPYALAVFLMTVYTRIDSVMVERMLVDGKLEADRYASAYRLLDACNMIGFLFAGLLLPMFARMIKAGEPTGGLAQLSFQTIWAGAIPLALATYFYQEEIMVLLYTNGNGYSGLIMAYLIFSFLAISGSYIYGSLLTANGSLKKMNIIFTLSVVLNVVLNLWLIPSHKALGAAQATCATQFLVFFCQVILAKAELKLQAAPMMVLRLGTFILLLFAIGYASFHYWDIVWPVKFLIIILTGLPIAFLLKLIDLRQLRLILLERK